MIPDRFGGQVGNIFSLIQPFQQFPAAHPRHRAHHSQKANCLIKGFTSVKSFRQMNSKNSNLCDYVLKK